jgi:hypothetical protein
MSTPNMLLSLPTVSVTIGPQWASELNAALETVDAHDHSSDKGARITPAGLNINANLDISNNVFYNFGAVRFQETGAALTGSANANALHSVAGNLYFTNGSGNAVQITSGGSIAASPGSASTFETTAVSTNLVIGPSDTFVYLIVDTTASRSITLPLASGVSDGRIYVIKDSSGQSETNNITINVSGSDTVDGASSQVLSSNYGSWMIVGDSSSAWYIS